MLATLDLIVVVDTLRAPDELGNGETLFATAGPWSAKEEVEVYTGCRQGFSPRRTA